jgi:hypothetical protein
MVMLNVRTEMEELVQLGFGNAMVASDSPTGLDFLLVNSTLDPGVGAGQLRVESTVFPYSSTPLLFALSATYASNHICQIRYKGRNHIEH